MILRFHWRFFYIWIFEKIIRHFYPQLFIYVLILSLSWLRLSLPQMSFIQGELTRWRVGGSGSAAKGSHKKSNFFGGPASISSQYHLHRLPSMANKYYLHGLVSLACQYHLDRLASMASQYYLHGLVSLTSQYHLDRLPSMASQYHLDRLARAWQASTTYTLL